MMLGSNGQIILYMPVQSHPDLQPSDQDSQVTSIGRLLQNKHSRCHQIFHGICGVAYRVSID